MDAKNSFSLLHMRQLNDRMDKYRQKLYESLINDAPRLEREILEGVLMFLSIPFTFSSEESNNFFPKERFISDLNSELKINSSELRTLVLRSFPQEIMVSLILLSPDIELLRKECDSRLWKVFTSDDLLPSPPVVSFKEAPYLSLEERWYAFELLLILIFHEKGFFFSPTKSIQTLYPLYVCGGKSFSNRFPLSPHASTNDPKGTNQNFSSQNHIADGLFDNPRFRHKKLIIRGLLNSIVLLTDTGIQSLLQVLLFDDRITESETIEGTTKIGRLLNSPIKDVFLSSSFFTNSSHSCSTSSSCAVNVLPDFIQFVSLSPIHDQQEYFPPSCNEHQLTGKASRKNIAPYDKIHHIQFFPNYVPWEEVWRRYAVQLVYLTEWNAAHFAKNLAAAESVTTDNDLMTSKNDNSSKVLESFLNLKKSLWVDSETLEERLHGALGIIISNLTTLPPRSHKQYSFSFRRLQIFNRWFLTPSFIVLKKMGRAGVAHLQDKVFSSKTIFDYAKSIRLAFQRLWTITHGIARIRHSTHHLCESLTHFDSSFDAMAKPPKDIFLRIFDATIGGVLTYVGYLLVSVKGGSQANGGDNRGSSDFFSHLELTTIQLPFLELIWGHWMDLMHFREEMAWTIVRYLASNCPILLSCISPTNLFLMEENATPPIVGQDVSSSTSFLFQQLRNDPISGESSVEEPYSFLPYPAYGLLHLCSLKSAYRFIPVLFRMLLRGLQHEKYLPQKSLVSERQNSYMESYEKDSIQSSMLFLLYSFLVKFDASVLFGSEISVLESMEILYSLLSLSDMVQMWSCRYLHSFWGQEVTILLKFLERDFSRSCSTMDGDPAKMNLSQADYLRKLCRMLEKIQALISNNLLTKETDGSDNYTIEATIAELSHSSRRSDLDELICNVSQTLSHANCWLKNMHTETTHKETSRLVFEGENSNYNKLNKLLDTVELHSTEVNSAIQTVSWIQIANFLEDIYDRSIFQCAAISNVSDGVGVSSKVGYENNWSKLGSRILELGISTWYYSNEICAFLYAVKSVAFVILSRMEFFTHISIPSHAAPEFSNSDIQVLEEKVIHTFSFILLRVLTYSVADDAILVDLSKFLLKSEVVTQTKSKKSSTLKDICSFLPNKLDPCKVVLMQIRILDVLLMIVDLDFEGQTIRRIEEAIYERNAGIRSLYELLLIVFIPISELSHRGSFSNNAMISAELESLLIARQVATIHFIGCYASRAFPKVSLSKLCILCRDIFRSPSTHIMSHAAAASMLAHIVDVLENNGSLEVLNEIDLDTIQSMASAMMGYRTPIPIVSTLSDEFNTKIINEERFQKESKVVVDEITIASDKFIPMNQVSHEEVIAKYGRMILDSLRRLKKTISFIEPFTSELSTNPV